MLLSAKMSVPVALHKVLKVLTSLVLPIKQVSERHPQKIEAWNSGLQITLQQIEISWHVDMFVKTR